jgi:hypothetical protein
LTNQYPEQIFESANRLTTFALSLRVVTDPAADDLNTNLTGEPPDRRFSKCYCSDLADWAARKYKKVTANGEKKFEF